MRRSLLLLATALLSACGHGPVETADAGPGPTTLAAAGGKLDDLVFAVVGDTRPANPDDNAGYPTQVITKIYQDLEALSPKPAFAVGTGDYQYTSNNGNAAIQIGDYAAAMKLFSGPVFPAMGNHECTGYTASNCGAGNADGITTNLTEFESQMLGPIGQTQPYYSVPIQAADGSWTAKIVVIAANAWDQAQATWLDQALTPATTYTFVVRHEPSSAQTAPGVGPSDQILGNHPYTLLLVGHSHEYNHPAASGSSYCGCDYRELIVGNGGAPMSSYGGSSYGFALVTRQSNGNLSVQQYDYDSNAPAGISFTVTPSGQQGS
ncbi:MAG: metallophosphoesterase family protein [Deltaproteobacteria bacterium]